MSGGLAVAEETSSMSVHTRHYWLDDIIPCWLFAGGVFRVWMCGLGYPSTKMCMRALCDGGQSLGTGFIRLHVLVQRSEESEF